MSIILIRLKENIYAAAATKKNASQQTRSHMAHHQRSVTSVPDGVSWQVEIGLHQFDCLSQVKNSLEVTRMWANAQPDGRPAEHRWRPLFNAQSLADAHYLTAVQ